MAYSRYSYLRKTILPYDVRFSSKRHDISSRSFIRQLGISLAAIVATTGYGGLRAANKNDYRDSFANPIDFLAKE